jgi:hypothetical protein
MLGPQREGFAGGLETALISLEISVALGAGLQRIQARQ